MKTSTKNTIYVTLVSMIALFIPALIFSKWLEAIIFFFCSWFIREQFPKQYHHIVPAMCRIITACVMFFGVSFMLPLELSLLSAVPICYFISWVGYVKKTSDELEVRCDEMENKIAELITKLKKYKNIDIYKMSEAELRQYAQSKGLSENICDTLVLKVIQNYRWVDIEKERNFTKEGIRYHKQRIIEVLEIDL